MNLITAPFSTLFGQFLGLFIDQVMARVQEYAVLSAIPAVAAVTLYIVVRMLQQVWGGSDNPLGDFLRICVRGIIVLAGVGAASYMVDIGRTLLITIPNGIGLGVNNATGGNGAFGMQTFDQLWRQEWGSVLIFYKAMKWSSLGTIPLGIVGILGAAIGGLFIGVTASVYIAMFSSLGVAVIFGPPLAMCILIESRLGWFNSWIGVVVGSLATMIAVIVIATIMSNAITASGGAMGALSQSNGGAGEWTMQLALVWGVVVILAVMALLVVKVEPLMRHIFSATAAGLEWFSQSANRWMVATPISHTAQVLAKAGDKLAGAAGLRGLTPTGRAP